MSNNIYHVIYFYLKKNNIFFYPEFDTFLQTCYISGLETDSKSGKTRVDSGLECLIIYITIYH